MTVSLFAALVTAAVIGMSFNSTRWIGLGSIVILSYIKPFIVFPLIIMIWVLYLYWKFKK